MLRVWLEDGSSCCVVGNRSVMEAAVNNDDQQPMRSELMYHSCLYIFELTYDYLVDLYLVVVP